MTPSLLRILRHTFPFFATIITVACGVNARLVHAANRVEYSEFDPAPTGSLRVTVPTVAWRIVPHGSSRVTAVRLLLNSRPVSAVYELSRQAVWYTPSAPLGAGVYAVHCSVTLDDTFEVAKDWQFTVVPEAVQSLGRPDKTQQGICDAINDVRRSLKLPALTVDPRLCAAADGHSAYLVRNRAVGHDQKPGLPGFVGEHVSDRVHAYGFAGGSFEAIAQGSVGTAAVRGLFDAPYHRAPFLQPGVFEIGAGIRSDIVTVLFGSSADAGVVTYPSDGQVGVPTTWSGVEEPNPMRVHQRDAPFKPTGYIISLFRFGPDDPHLTVNNATLATLDGKSVPIYVNTPTNDDFLQFGVLIIPQQVLLPGTTYRVEVQAVDDVGDDCSRSWSFTTAASVPPSLAAKKKKAIP